MMEKNHNQILMDEKYRIRDQVLNPISPTFCAAKWMQSTIYLWNGFTHSCHHPVAHKVEQSAVEANPKALHNTPIKFVARKDLLNGIQTPECQYCWNIENAGDHLSDRTYKSSSPWAIHHLQRIKKAGAEGDINPSYLEVAFDHTCNLKCSYCSPEVSSKWIEEIERHGPYNMTWGNAHDLNWLKQQGKLPIGKDEYNPYVEAFWKWWPELVNSLEVFRITGGEPLLSKHTWAVFDYLIENPKPNLELAMNTNLSVPSKLIDRLMEYAQKLKGKVKSFDIYTSLEATGEQAEYIRYGLNYKEFVSNCHRVLSETDCRLHFMVSTNLLCAPSFNSFLDLIFDFRQKYNETDADNRIPMMIAYVRWPSQLNIRNLTYDLKDKYAKEWLANIESKTRKANPTIPGRFYLEEVDQLKRLIEFMNGTEQSRIDNLYNFFLFITQYDQRKGTNFKEVFPELVEFFDHCSELYESK